MPWGLWKSRWEIHREDLDRRHGAFREEMIRRDAKFRQVMIARDAAFREDMKSRDAEFRAERAAADAEWRKGNDELMAGIEKNRRESMAAFKIVIEELRGIRRELNDLTDAVHANTEAVLKLIDRFDQWEGRPPGSGRMGPRSA